MMDKTEVMKDLKFYQELMERLIKFAEKNYKSGKYVNYNYIPVQNDIIRLRRELNEVRKKIEE